MQKFLHPVVIFSSYIILYILKLDVETACPEIRRPKMYYV
jgi:hypothetical protein